MTEGIELGLLMSSRMSGRENGRAFLEMLPAAYMPEKYNDHEPINKKFDDIEEALNCWGWGFLWRRQKPRILGRAWAGNNRRTHDSVYISVPVIDFDLEETLKFFEKIENKFGIDIAYIHGKSPQDSGENYRRFIMPFSQGLSTHRLREGLPGLCWGMVFGTPYAELFGARLDDVPVYAKQDIGNCTYLQLTESILDVDRKREEYEATQKSAKEHLNCNVFRVMNRSGPYRIPNFKLS